MHPSIAIISPHQDDAVFSLAECVRRLVPGGVPVHVVNCFTRSEHAPYRAPGDDRSASAVRAAEDRAALRAVGVHELTDLGGLDAPLRLGVRVADVCTDRPLDAAGEIEARRLASAIGHVVSADLLLAPLAAPGGHVDHRVARRAAVLARPGRVAFYEDLPYAARIPAAAVQAAVDDATLDAGGPLVPLPIAAADGGRAKRTAAALYVSQLAPGDVDRLDCGGAERGYAERIWATRSLMRSITRSLTS